jgi:hypothetical protein
MGPRIGAAIIIVVCLIGAVVFFDRIHLTLEQAGLLDPRARIAIQQADAARRNQVPPPVASTSPTVAGAPAPPTASGVPTKVADLGNGWSRWLCNGVYYRLPPKPTPHSVIAVQNGVVGWRQ